ncbi:MAG: rod shape-determining protein MreC [Melioribacteraceae bacterium]|nr:rod shape-determining protein MreC [Melioribacteraceae bacterium]
MEILIRKLFNKSKEYMLLILLLIISLSIIPQNNNPEIRKIKTYAFATFAIFGNLIESTSSLFCSDDELIELRKENAELMLAVNSLREYALENSELKKILSFKLTSNYDLIPSTIVSKNISNTQGAYIINSGFKDNISKSMPVINEKGLIGIISEASADFALVQTLTNSSLRISATIPRSNVNGIVRWDGSHLIMQNIPTTADINKGDRVVTSVLSTIFPPSIPVGLVVKKESNISGLLSNVTIKPFVDVYSVKNVFVLESVESTQIDSLELNLLSK